MTQSSPILLSVTVLLLASLACTSTVVPATQDLNFYNTVVAQTVEVALTQTQQSGLSPTLILPVTDTPSMTLTPEPPTFTPTVTLTSTPVFTSTPLVPLISVSLATNCREGPGRIYDRVGALLVGQTAEVFGRNAVGDYWYIRNPNNSDGFCWLWGEYAAFSGNTSVLPVYTPPPTPTPMPDFEASYAGKDTCSGWWVELELGNTGGLNFKSLSLTVRDTVTDIVLSLYTDGFVNKDGCSNVTTRDNLQPGTSRIVSSAPFAYDPTGHLLRATTTVCSNPGQNGTCVTKVIEFRP
jgi:hypothetical protein